MKYFAFGALGAFAVLAAISDGSRLVRNARAQVGSDDDSSAPADASFSDASDTDVEGEAAPQQTCGLQAFVGDGATTRWGPTIPLQADINFVLLANVMAASGTLGGAEISSRTVTIRKRDTGGATHFLVTIEPAVPAGGGFEVDWCVVR